MFICLRTYSSIIYQAYCSTGSDNMFIGWTLNYPIVVNQHCMWLEVSEQNFSHQYGTQPSFPILLPKSLLYCELQVVQFIQHLPCDRCVRIRQVLLHLLLAPGLHFRVLSYAQQEPGHASRSSLQLPVFSTKQVYYYIVISQVQSVNFGQNMHVSFNLILF